MRVVSGELGGRKLVTPDGDEDASDVERVREAIFNSLFSLDAIDGARVLDAFAGSGALGIEALSRGADHATFVETGRNALAALRDNLETLRLGAAARVVPGDALAHLERTAAEGGAYDLVLLDPPYGFDDWAVMLAAVPEDAMVVIESDREIELPDSWEVQRVKRYGSTVVTIASSTTAMRNQKTSRQQGSRREMTTRVLYPGSFDPVHNGHIEIISTASELFDEVVVAAMRNPQKGGGSFSLDEREEMVSEATAHLPNVTITMFSSLVVDLAREIDADFIIKGLRAVSDFENELQMAQMNNAVSGVQTLFIPSASKSSFLASKFIREIAKFGGDVSSMVPEGVNRRIMERFG